jgi:hypothetical protein
VSEVAARVAVWAKSGVTVRRTKRQKAKRRGKLARDLFTDEMIAEIK